MGASNGRADEVRSERAGPQFGSLRGGNLLLKGWGEPEYSARQEETFKKHQGLF
jgi:hypothetical protein